MNPATWPTWMAWVIIAGILLNLAVNICLLVKVNGLHAKVCKPPLPYHNREELDEAFRLGTLDRDHYERYKARLTHMQNQQW